MRKFGWTTDVWIWMLVIQSRLSLRIKIKPGIQIVHNLNLQFRVAIIQAGRLNGGHKIAYLQRYQFKNTIQSIFSSKDLLQIFCCFQ